MFWYVYAALDHDINIHEACSLHSQMYAVIKNAETWVYTRLTYSGAVLAKHVDMYMEI